MVARTRVFLTMNAQELGQSVKSNIDKAMFEGGKVVAEAVQLRARGSMAASVYVATERRSTYKAGPENEKERRPGKGEVVVGAASFLSHFFEAGTYKMAARPFFRPAFDATKAQAAARAAEVLREGLGRA